jgi:hypothetical protein
MMFVSFQGTAEEVKKQPGNRKNNQETGDMSCLVYGFLLE